MKFQLRKKGFILQLIQVTSVILESLVKDLTLAYIKKFDSSMKIKKLYKHRKRIDYLKSKNVIKTKLYLNLIILSEIRNKALHTIFNDRTIFEDLNKVNFGSKWILNAPNDYRKYQGTAFYCALHVAKLLNDINPKILKKGDEEFLEGYKNL